MQTGLGILELESVLTAVKLQLFTVLGPRAMTGGELGKTLGLHPRGIWDFFDALVALGLLQREGDGPDGRYANTDETAAFLDKNRPEYVGGMLEMCNDRLFRFWSDLDTALKTGEPQNEVKHSQKGMFEELYADPARLEQFMRAMAGISHANFAALADKVDFSRWQTLCDVGGATGLLSILVATRHPHLRCTSFDLPEVAPIAAKSIQKAGLVDRITTVKGSFFTDPLPKADVITMGHDPAYDWNLEKKKHLIKAAQALPGGRPSSRSRTHSTTHDARTRSASHVAEHVDRVWEAFDFTGADFGAGRASRVLSLARWCTLAGPCSAAIAFIR
jgi:hypothetical protein